MRWTIRPMVGIIVLVYSSIFLIFIAVQSLLYFSPKKGFEVRVKRVIDGDTILLENGEYVRYIGIDTNETKHPFKEKGLLATEATQCNRMLVEGKKVYLMFDAQKRDKYNRLLAYVWWKNVFINAYLVQHGYARAYSIPPNQTYSHFFKNVEQEARATQQGIWKNK